MLFYAYLPVLSSVELLKSFFKTLSIINNYFFICCTHYNLCKVFHLDHLFSNPHPRQKQYSQGLDVSLSFASHDPLLQRMYLKNCLFGAVTLTKNADIDKYGYSDYGIEFDRRGSFSFPSGGFGQNVLIFGVDMSFSAHIDNKKKDILVLGIGPTQVLEHALTAEKMYSINFTVAKKKFCLSLHYN